MINCLTFISKNITQIFDLLLWRYQYPLFPGTIFPGKFWIDITDLLNPKDWKRMSDKKALNFTNWDTTSGTVTSEEGARNCVYMSESLDYRWVPASCVETINFLCYHAG